LWVGRRAVLVGWAAGPPCSGPLDRGFTQEHASRVTIHGMRVASGKVVRGKIVYEGDFPEGADVTLIADDQEAGFHVDPELKAVLLQAIAECDRGEKISADELLRELT